jgi:phage pi2 protein 07
MEQSLTAQVTMIIPEEKVLIDKVEYQELKKQEFDGWVGMKEFVNKSNRSAPTIAKVLKRPELIQSLSVENGGWIFYPEDGNHWSFHYKEMMEFINREFYQNYSGGSSLS